MLTRSAGDRAHNNQWKDWVPADENPTKISFSPGWYDISRACLDMRFFFRRSSWYPIAMTPAPQMIVLIADLSWRVICIFMWPSKEGVVLNFIVKSFLDIVVTFLRSSGWLSLPTEVDTWWDLRYCFHRFPVLLWKPNFTGWQYIFLPWSLHNLSYNWQ